MTTLLDRQVQETPAPSTPKSTLEKLEGPRRTALKRRGQDLWLVVENRHLDGGGLPLGLQIELDRSDAGRGDGFGTQRALSARALPVKPPRLAPPRVLAAGAGLLVLGLAGLLSGSARFPIPFAETVQEGDALAVVVVLAWLTFVLLRTAEAGLVGSQLRANVPWARTFGIAPRVEPVCWRLGLAPAAPQAAAALPVAGLVAAAGWGGPLPALAVGMATGCLLWMALALYPLRPGVGACLLEDQLRVRDLPTRLRWTLVSRFLPVPSRLQVEGSRPMVTAALAVFAWAAATGWMLSWISLPPPEGATLWGRLWQAGAALLLLGWTVWLVVRSTSLVVSALSLRTPTGLLAIEPSDALRQAWLEQNPLNRHLPVLEKARWAWHMAPPGSVLIRQGAEERHFLWLARGSADVLARSPGGDPILVAALRGGCGVGEVALLEGGRRTADVIAREACVVATLEREEFERITDTEARGRFRELVQASQTLARAPALWGLAPDDRASWLSRGSRRVHRAGEVLMRQGDPGRWMGLVVEGRVLVERDGVRVAELGPDDVFGEMAFLDHAPRRATLTAQEPVLCWSWDADFLDRAIGTGELKESLARLAGERSG